MSLTYAHGREFVQYVRPLVEAQDKQALADYLDKRWPGDRLRGILETRHEEAIKIALIGLALKGTSDDISSILHHLRSKEAYLAGLAEHALWCIWFRASTPENNDALIEAVEAISRKHLGKALRLLEAVLNCDPEFAEAYNQLAAAQFLRGRYDLAILSGRETLSRIPEHFGALAGLGHSYAAIGRYARATQYYHQALRIHPHLHGIRQAVAEVVARIQREDKGRGEFSPPPPDKPGPGYA